jgi:hypothetical protein
MLFFAQAVVASPGASQTVSSITQSFSTIGQNLSTRLFDVGMALYIDTLGPMALDFAQTVFPLVLMAELMFVGFRIIMKENFIQQMLRIILITIINFVIIYSQYPQQLLISGMMSMEKAGKSAAVDIISSPGMLPTNLTITSTQLTSAVSTTTNAATTPQTTVLIGSQAAQSAEQLYSAGQNPIVSAWALWIGSPDSKATAPYFKYSPLYYHNVLFAGKIIGGNLSAGSIATSVNAKLTTVLQTWSDTMATDSGANNPAAAQTNADPTQSYSNLLTALANHTVNLGALIVAFFAPMQFLTLSLTLASFMMAGLMLPGLTAGTILGSAYLTFFIALGMGVCIVPFAYFRTLEKSWNKWLRVLFGMALVPFIYYIFGAIGFVFSVDIYDVLFSYNITSAGPVANSGTLASVLATTFNYAISEGMLLQAGINNTNAGHASDWAQSLISYLTFIMQFFAQNSAGAVITTTFITIGCTFPGIALKVASNWESGFAEPGIMEQLQGGLNQIQGSISQGFNTGMQAGMQTMTSMASRVL